MASLGQAGLSMLGIAGAISGSIEGLLPAHVAPAPPQEPSLITVDDTGCVFVNVDSLQLPHPTQESEQPSITQLHQGVLDTLFFNADGLFKELYPDISVVSCSIWYRTMRYSKNTLVTPDLITPENTIAIGIPNTGTILYYIDPRFQRWEGYPVVQAPKFLARDTNGDGKFLGDTGFPLNDGNPPHYASAWLEMTINGQSVMVGGEENALSAVLHQPEVEGEILYLYTLKKNGDNTVDLAVSFLTTNSELQAYLPLASDDLTAIMDHLPSDVQANVQY